MSLRIRPDGRVLCAAMHPAEDGDVYLDDEQHYTLSAKLRCLEPLPGGHWAFVAAGAARPDCEDHNLLDGRRFRGDLGRWVHEPTGPDWSRDGHDTADGPCVCGAWHTADPAVVVQEDDGDPG